MKHTEQRWMHISTGLLVERGRKPDNSANDYRTVTVTYDEPEPQAWETSIWSRDYIPHVSGRIEVISDDEEK